MILTTEQQAEVAANRKRYEELKAAGQGHAPRALPSPTPRDGAAIATSAIIHREIIPGGWYWTTRLNRGEALRLVNTDGHILYQPAGMARGRCKRAAKSRGHH